MPRPVTAHANMIKTNLYFSIFIISGRLNSRIEPAEYMKMYSYGVYLVDALQVCTYLFGWSKTSILY